MSSDKGKNVKEDDLYREFEELAFTAAESLVVFEEAHKLEFLKPKPKEDKYHLMRRLQALRIVLNYILEGLEKEWKEELDRRKELRFQKPKTPATPNNVYTFPTTGGESGSSSRPVTFAFSNHKGSGELGSRKPCARRMLRFEFEEEKDKTKTRVEIPTYTPVKRVVESSFRKEAREAKRRKNMSVLRSEGWIGTHDLMEDMIIYERKPLTPIIVPSEKKEGAEPDFEEDPEEEEEDDSEDVVDSDQETEDSEDEDDVFGEVRSARHNESGDDSEDDSDFYS